jgi:hypothetical protein
MNDNRPDERVHDVQIEPKLAPLPAKRQQAKPLAVIPTSPAEMLGLAVQQGASVEQLDKLISLMERTRAIDARQAYVNAMVAFRNQQITVSTNQTGEVRKDGKLAYSYRYADLAAINDKVTAGLAQVGISHNWTTKQESGMIHVTCTLTHQMGHSESTTLAAGADQSGGKNSIQAIGSTVSYLRRYTLLAITGIAVEGEDDDGAGVTGDERAEMRQAARDMRRPPRPADVAAQRQQAPKEAEPALLDAARDAADQGRAAFETFWKSINGHKRTMLGGLLDELQRRCDAADKKEGQ